MSICLDSADYEYSSGLPYAHKVLDAVSVEINEGEFVAIIGHTGSGKSTLVQLLNGLLTPSAGTVIVDGVNLQEKGEAAKKARQSIGMVFQYPEHQLFEETVYEDIAFGPRNLGLSEADIEERIKRSMEFVQLDYEQYRERSPFQLSGGQMRRAAIAGVIALEPKYLILDEPAAGLDPITKRRIFSQLRKMHKKDKKTIIMVSHDMDDTAALAERVLVLDSGRIIMDGTPKQVFSQAKQLCSIGLNVPQVTQTMQLLSDKGIIDKSTALTIDEAVAELKNVISGGRKKC